MSRPIDAEILKKDISKYRKSLKPEYIMKLTDAMLKDIEDIVSEQPTVDAVPVVHGHWVSEINSYGETTAWHCSNCYERTGFFTTGQSNYCPECGAKMDEKSTEERADEM